METNSLFFPFEEENEWAKNPSLNLCDILISLCTGNVSLRQRSLFSYNATLSFSYWISLESFVASDVTRFMSFLQTD